MGRGPPFPDHPLAAPSGQERPQGPGAEAPARRGASLGVLPRAGSEPPTGWGGACPPAGLFRKLIKGSFATLTWKTEIKTH